MLNSVLEQLEGMPPRLQGKPAERGECGIGHSGQRIVATDEAHLPGNDDSHGRKSGVCSLSRQVIKRKDRGHLCGDGLFGSLFTAFETGF